MDEERPDPAPEAPRPTPLEAASFPAVADPPWRRRRTLLALAGLPVVLIAGVALVLALGGWKAESVDGRGDAQLGASSDEIDPVDLALAQIDERDGEADPATDEPEEDEGPPWGEVDGIGEEDDDPEGPEGETDDEHGPGGDWRRVPASPAPAPTGGRVHEGRVGKGLTVQKRLIDHGLSPRAAHTVVTALDGHFDFRRSRPSDSYRVELGPGPDEVVRFRYQPGLTELYEVVPGPEGYQGRKVKVPTELRRLRKGLRVWGSLAESVKRAGLERGILTTLLRAFDSDINFQNQQREGDGLRVVADEEWLDGRFIGYKNIWAFEYAGQLVGTRRAFFFQAGEDDGRFYDADGLAIERRSLATPLRYTRITSPFDPARLHPILGRRTPHNGVDFSAPRGTPVWATADGGVRFVGRKGAAGNLVILEHDDGLESIYAHLQKFARGVERGASVRQRQVIGYVGSTGRSTGPHLHFGLRKGGRFIDPLKMKSRPGPPVDARHRGKYRNHARQLARELDAIRLPGSS